MILQLEDNIACKFFDVYNFQIIKQKVYLPSENLYQLIGLNVGFLSVMLVLGDIYST